MADDRIARIERCIMQAHLADSWFAVLADLYAWQEIAERHQPRRPAWCCYDGFDWPCPDRQAADDALDRLDALWGTDDPLNSEGDPVQAPCDQCGVVPRKWIGCACEGGESRG